MIGMTDLFISLRMIPLVLAYSMKVPSIAISCLEKISSFSDMVGMKYIDLEKFNAETLMQTVNTIKKKPQRTQKNNNREG